MVQEPEEVAEQAPPVETVPEQAPVEEERQEEPQEEPQKQDSLIDRMKNSRFPWWIIAVLAALLLVFLFRFL